MNVNCDMKECTENLTIHLQGMVTFLSRTQAWQCPFIGNINVERLINGSFENIHGLEIMNNGFCPGFCPVVMVAFSICSLGFTSRDCN
jgi:hypothetical protein